VAAVSVFLSFVPFQTLKRRSQHRREIIFIMLKMAKFLIDQAWGQTDWPLRERTDKSRAPDERVGMTANYSEQIERMLDVMLCMPKSAWGLVLEKVEKKIGAAALRRIILRASKESDLKRGVAILDREEKRTEQERKEKQKARQRRKRA
jgi:hypothetical protein